MSNKCNLGGGDCDDDSHCNGILTCGNNNCRRDFSLSGSDWASSADCCDGNTLFRLIELIWCELQ